MATATRTASLRPGPGAARAIRSRTAHRATLAALSLLAAATSLASQAPPARTVDRLLAAWAETASPVGEKDTADNVAPLRFGHALWDTGERDGGYLGLVAQLAHESAATRYDQLAELGLTPARSEIREKLYPPLFEAPWSRFGDEDLERILAPVPGVDFLVAQNTIFAPRKSGAAAARDAAYPYEAFDYPSFTEKIAPRARRRGFAIAQSVGFTNHYALAPGEWEHDLEHPLVTKRAALALPGVELPSFGHRPWMVASFGREVPGIAQPVLRCPGSMLWPDVARAVARSIERRMTAFADQDGLAPVAYHILSGEIFQFGAASERPGSPVGAGEIEDEQSYLDHLSEADYSESSLLHFRRWLELRYGAGEAGLAALARAWGADVPSGGGSIRACAAIDPLELPRRQTVRDLAALAEDWLAFQRDQYHLGVYPFQYDAAKQARPDAYVYALEVNMQGAERAALMTDGVVLRNFLRAGEGRSDALSPWKKALLHGVSYGESVHLPLFAMPRRADRTGCWLAGAQDDRPAQFGPPCWDAPYAYRLLREMLALGVDSLALGYYEGGSFSNIVAGDFGGQGRSMVQALGAEVAATRRAAAFMSPWRSPLLVHTGAAADTGHSNQPKDFYPRTGGSRSTSIALDVLARAQIQFAPFSLLEGLEDLWLGSEREVLLSLFVPELDRDLLARYRSVAEARGWTLLVLASAPQAAAALVGTEPPRIDAPQDLRGNAVGYRIARAAELWAIAPAEGADVEAAVRFVLRERMPALDRSIRPVRVATASGAAADLDVSVACDGLSYLVAIANPGETAQRVTLVVDAAPPTGAPDFAVTSPSAELQLGASDSALVYLPARIRGLEQLVDGLPAAVDRARHEVDALRARGFATAAAGSLLAELHELMRVPPPERAAEKILAGLLRLERMLFLRGAPAPGSKCALSAASLHGEPVPGAPIQIELVLQLRHRRDGGTTDAAGNAVLDCTPLSIAQAPLWDFVRRDYVVPETNLVEVQAQHPRHGTQATTGVLRVPP
jgi:hypothetical protein